MRGHEYIAESQSFYTYDDSMSNVLILFSKIYGENFFQ